MAKAIVICEADYTHVTGATKLETTIDGKIASSIDVPGSTYNYVAGKEYQFSSKKNANEFIRFHNGRGGKFRLK